jgi:hypothetical protein
VARHFCHKYQTQKKNNGSLRKMNKWFFFFFLDISHPLTSLHSHISHIFFPFFILFFLFFFNFLLSLADKLHHHPFLFFFFLPQPTPLTHPTLIFFFSPSPLHFNEVEERGKLKYQFLMLKRDAGQ